MNMYINPKTKEKIKRIANEAFKKFGNEVTELSNYRSIINKENERLVEPMSRITLNKYIGYLTVCIHNLKTETKIVESLETPQPQPEAVVEAVKELEYSINFYKDGTFERIEPKVEVIEPQPEEEPYVIYFGLFDYNHNKITIRRGKYSGCNVKSNLSILDYFGGLDWYETWCKERMNDIYTGYVPSNADTPKDMETLNMIVNEIYIKKRLSERQ
jgi:ribosomal protein S17E